MGWGPGVLRNLNVDGVLCHSWVLGSEMQSSLNGVVVLPGECCWGCSRIGVKIPMGSSAGAAEVEASPAIAEDGVRESPWTRQLSCPWDFYLCDWGWVLSFRFCRLTRWPWACWGCSSQGCRAEPGYPRNFEYLTCFLTSLLSRRLRESHSYSYQWDTKIKL